MKLIWETVKNQGNLLESAKTHTTGIIMKKAAHLVNVGFAAPDAQPSVRTSASARQSVNEVSKLP